MIKQSVFNLLWVIPVLLLAIFSPKGPAISSYNVETFPYPPPVSNDSQALLPYPPPNSGLPESPPL